MIAHDDPVRRLLCAVLLRAARDAAGRGPFKPCEERRVIQTEARAWLAGDGLMVAEMLGYDGALTRFLAREGA